MSCRFIAENPNSRRSEVITIVYNRGALEFYSWVSFYRVRILLLFRIQNVRTQNGKYCEVRSRLVEGYHVLASYTNTHRPGHLFPRQKLSLHKRLPPACSSIKTNSIILLYSTNAISIIERVYGAHGKFTYNDVMRLVIILSVWWRSCVTGCPNMFQVIEYGVGKMTYHITYIAGNSTKCPP